MSVDATDKYKYVDDWGPDRSGRCPECAGEVRRWSEEVPCCGCPYTCTDTLYVVACDACEIVSNHW